MMSATRSRPVVDDDEQPLLQDDARRTTPEDAESGSDEKLLAARRRSGAAGLSPTASVIGMIGLLFIFAFLISTVLFGALYYQLVRDDPDKLPPWPKPSHSLLGEYSTAAVAADNELCSEIGRDILLQGGNAVDAAVATLLCIGVMDTQSAGLGGGLFMTVYNASTRTCHAIDAREAAPLAAREDMYKGRPNASRYGWQAVAVPGQLHGLWTAFARYGSGRLPWGGLLRATIRLMREGYPTSHALEAGLRQNARAILDEPTMRVHFVNPATGRLYLRGQQITTRQNLLQTFETLAASPDPVAEFYTGPMAQAIVEEFRRYGGLITSEDLARYRSIVRRDADVLYTRLSQGRVACGPPPPSGAAVAMAVLNVMDGIPFNLTTFPGTVALFHDFIEASKFAYAVRSELGDMDFIGNASQIAKNITGQPWADGVRARMRPTAQPDAHYGGHFRAAAEDHGTSHVSVVDKWGNAVAVTSTINLVMGSQRMSEATGILWNDNMDDFSTPGRPNYFGYPPTPANFIRPGKRPLSSMSPLVIFHADEGSKREVMAVGAAGGSTIISGVAGTVLRSLWMRKDVKQSIDMPRLHNQLTPNVTLYEGDWPERYLDALAARGHTLKRQGHLGVVTAVLRKEDGGVYANSDYRKGTESEPAGY